MDGVRVRNIPANHWFHDQGLAVLTLGASVQLAQQYIWRALADAFVSGFISAPNSTINIDGGDMGVG